MICIALFEGRKGLFKTNLKNQKLLSLLQVKFRAPLSGMVPANPYYLSPFPSHFLCTSAYFKTLIK